MGAGAAVVVVCSVNEEVSDEGFTDDNVEER